MNKTICLMVLGLLVFSIAGTFVFAEEENSLDSNLAISAEPIPEDSTTGVFWDGFRRTFTFNKEKKAEISMRIAEKRMLRAGECSEEENYDCAQKMIQKQEEAMLRAEAYLDDIEKNGDENATRLALARSIAMQNRVEAQEERALEIKARILERQGEVMTEEQLAHLEEVFASIENRSQERKQKVEQRQETLRERYKELTGMTDEEVTDTLAQYMGYLEQRRLMREANTQAQNMKVQQYKERIQAMNESGEFHNETVAAGGLNGSGAQGNK